jgi:hypothetical protein
MVDYEPRVEKENTQDESSCNTRPDESLRGFDPYSMGEREKEIALRASLNSGSNVGDASGSAIRLG